MRYIFIFIHNLSVIMLIQWKYYFSHSNNIYQILSKRIIDRNWFHHHIECFHIENPDSNWF